MEIKVSKKYMAVRNFLFSKVNKEFLVFLFFLALSSIFWLMMTLNETYEQEVSVPVKLFNIPNNAVLTTDINDTLHVTVRDKGYTLATYIYGDIVKPIRLNFMAYANKNTGRGAVSLSELQKLARQSFMGSSKIVSIKPDKLEFYFNFGQSKIVQVRLNGEVIPGKEYYLARTKFWPEYVTVYANQNTLDSIRCILTEPLRIKNLSDTMVRTVNLIAMKGIKVVPAQVKIGLYPDILTEESAEVPITALNMPEGKALRTFPSKVNVKFNVGASMFRKIDTNQFTVVVDYREIAGKPSSKCNVYLRSAPSGVRNAHLETTQVDYLIEQQ